MRQQAGFGCCKCGLPITQYHHIIERSEDSKDIMLLCPNHHWEATSGAMTLEEQLHYKLNSINIEKNHVQGLLKINQKVPVMIVGTNQIIGEGDLILIDNECLLSLSVISGSLEISAKLFDPAGQLIAQIENNEWVSGEPFPWDIQSDYQWLTIHHKRRAIALEIDATVLPLRLRANLWFNQQNFQLDPSQIRFHGVVQNIRFSHLCFVGFTFSADTKSKKFSFGPRRGLKKASMITEANVSERIRKGIEAWEAIQANEVG